MRRAAPSVAGAWRPTAESAAQPQPEASAPAPAGPEPEVFSAVLAAVAAEPYASPRSPAALQQRQPPQAQQPQGYAQPQMQQQLQPQAYAPPAAPVPVPVTPVRQSKPRRSPGSSRRKAASSSGRNRIDPNQIPRPDLSWIPWAEHAARVAAETPALMTMSYVVPPSALDVQAGAILDDGCAAPQYMRSTLCGVPTEAELMNEFGVPFAVHVAPLARPSGAPVPEIDPALCLGGVGSDGSSLRCERCRAYINPHVEWIESGAAYNCSLCGWRNSLPRGAVCPLDERGRRRDHGRYPEVKYGSVDYAAPATMAARSLEPPAYIFCIDVSYTAIACGLLHAAVHCIRSLLDRVSDQPRVRIGVMTYSTELQFYDLSTSRGSVALLSVPDVDDPFVPIPFDNWVVSAVEGRDRLLEMLEMMQALHVELDTRRSTAAAGSALKAVVGAVREANCCARVVLIASMLPSIGLGTLRTREAAQHYGKAAEQDMLLPTPDEAMHSFYDELAMEAGTSGIGIDICLCTNRYVDAATLSLLPQRTGGELRWWGGFSGARYADVRSLQSFVEGVVLRTAGWDGVLKLRCSTGLKVTKYNGNCLDPTKPEVTIATIDTESCITVELQQIGSFDVGGCVCLQAALLYTRSDGQRMIRVHTLRLFVCDSLSMLFKHADLHATAVAFAKSSCAMVREVTDATIMEVRRRLNSHIIDVLFAYRSSCASKTDRGQLILPDSLKLIPLYITGLLKHAALRVNRCVCVCVCVCARACACLCVRAWTTVMCTLRRESSHLTSPSFLPSFLPSSLSSDSRRRSMKDVDVRADERVAGLALIARWPVDLTIAMLYPLTVHVGAPSDTMGARCWPSAEQLSLNGIYLLENGFEIILYVGERAPIDSLQLLFQTDRMDEEIAAVRCAASFFV